MLDANRWMQAVRYFNDESRTASSGGTDVLHGVRSCSCDEGCNWRWSRNVDACSHESFERTKTTLDKNYLISSCRGFSRWDLAVEKHSESVVWVVMSGVDTASSSSLTSHHDSEPDILDHDLLSPTQHSVLPTHDHHVALELELACLAQSDTALDDPAAHMALQRSRDHIFGDIEHVPDHVKDDHITMVEAVDPAVTQQDSQQHSPESSLELKRVKVYELIGSRWVDQGTAYCAGQLDDANQAYLVARSEQDFNKIILSTAIRSNDVYQRQQESLIVWTEPNGADYALSFQDAEGCAEVWNFIIEVQRHLNSGDQGIGSSSPGGEHSATTVSIIRTGHLPTPQLGNIQDIEGAIKTLSRGQAVKEKICEYIQREHYIKALIDVLNMAEDLESIDNLHALCSLMQTILMMNDHGIYEHILEDDIFFGVVGMLEYDPEFPTHKANYREFLHVNAQFHQPIAIRDDLIRKKVHHTYRLQFLKDVVLARALDDSTFNVLNSCIIFNQIDIINHIQNDPVFLHDIVRLYVSEEVLAGPKTGSEDDDEDEAGSKGPGKKLHEKFPNQDGARTTTQFSFGPPGDLSTSDITFRHEVVVLVQQLCAMGKNVQLPARLQLFRTLVDRGILFAVQWAFSLPEKEEASRSVVSAAGEIMSILLDHDLHGVRGHVCKQATALEREKETGRLGADKAETLLKLMCRVMVQSRDVAVQCQIGDALKALLDVSQNIGGPGATPAAISAKILARPKDDPGTERFLDYFYKNCLELLFRPYNDIPDFRKRTDPTLKLSREKTNLFLYLSDLLCNFAQQHAFRSHFYMLSSNISVRVAALLNVRDKHLRLAAFRFFRICLKINNKNFLAHLIKLDVFKPILELTLQESHRDSLLSASCQEFFEHVRRENIKDLVTHCMTVHGDVVRKLSETRLGGPRFSAFVRRWEINIEPPPKEEVKDDRNSTDSRRADRSIDAEEEEYFNGDDDEGDAAPPFISSTAVASRAPSPLEVIKRRPRIAVAPSKLPRPQGLVLPRTPPLPSLLDYGDEDEEEIGPSSPETSTRLTKKSSPSPLSPSLDVPSSPRLAHRQISRPSSIPRRRTHEDDDNVLESLLRQKGSTCSPKPNHKSQLPPIRLSEKRRRENDDDEQLERLANKPKRADLGSQRREESVGGRAAMKPGDDPPKRMKVMFRPLGVAVAQSTSPVPPDPGAKDGDTG
ncbi:component of IIS longevity pathway SMK-1-domain-containing protein [Chiua virens]|nr:component of IIS longevity pathway SMK-1-domain-containing protein [Chiua virens]